MIVLRERKRDFTVIMAFVVGVAALVAWRGWAHARVAAWIAIVVAVAATTAALRDRRRPPREIHVSSDLIRAGRPDLDPATHEQIQRTASTVLRFRRGPRQGSPWYVTTLEHDRPTIDLFGFDPTELRRAAESLGWVFDGDLFASAS